MTQKYFHEIIGIELDGVVQSAPITQPSQTTWSSFDGQWRSRELHPDLAQNLAIALQYGRSGQARPPHGDRGVTDPRQVLAPRRLAAGIAGLILVLLTRSSTTGCWAWSS